jgi:hypothetical protein
VKIKVVHAECGREVLVQQILQTGGHCPWDGKPFSKDYTAVLAEALEAAEDSGSVLENALEKIAGMNPAMSIEPASVLGEIEAHVESLNRRQRGRPR